MMKKLLAVLLLLAFPVVVLAATNGPYYQIYCGSKRVTSPGGAEQISATSPKGGILYVTGFYEASHDNSPVFIGNSSVSAGGEWGYKTVKKGVVVKSNDVVVYPCGDLTKVYIATAHSQDGVSFVYLY